VLTESRGSDDGDPGTQVTLAFSYDTFGNITKTTADDAWMHHRASCTSYDAEGIFPFARRNPVGHLWVMDFDPGLGVQTSMVDPNQLVTQWAHDGFGRITQEQRPDGTATTYKLTRTQDGGSLHNLWSLKLETQTPGLADDTVEYDRLGRAIRGWTQGERALALAPSAEVCLMELK
jgi:YD repeat-containing protein